ncbi:Gem-associated protein [Trema orientale]|uniref:Gem-associated protein n=1 Tax=Trema orientale TaxID=63057 RepID=A0A2P5CQ81_TREOI|nr:Gem-associated protein [Trema orientale]
MAGTSSLDLDEPEPETKFGDFENKSDQAVEKEDHQHDQKQNPTAEDQTPNPNKPRELEPTTTTTEEAVESQTCLVVKKKQLLEELEAMIKASNSDNGGFAKEEVKTKPSRRRLKAMKRAVANQIGETHGGEGTAKRVYSREAMEALRFVKMEQQRKIWENVLTAIGPFGDNETSNLASSKHHKGTHFNFGNNQSIGKKEESPAILVNEIAETHSGEGTKMIYSREVMEALRFVNMEEQKKIWKHVLTGSGPVLPEEIVNLASCKRHKNIHVNFDAQQSTRKKEECPAILYEIFETHCGERKKMIYSREVMEALRFVSMEEQRKMWKRVLTGLGPVVQKEYKNLASSKHHKNTGKKEESPAILNNLPEVCSKDMDSGSTNMVRSETDDASPLNADCSYVVGDEDNYTDVEGEYNKDDDSDDDDDYASIQRPAFVVEGEPNFDSGPPEDGLEYLRRVRWEAAQIPKVRVAKLDRSKLKKEQSDYMPKIPEIAKCPEHLLPSKQWEGAFLAEFSQLRLALSRLEISRDLLSESYHLQLSGGISLESSKKYKTKVHSEQSGDCSSSENADDGLSSLSNDEDNKISSEPELSTPKSTVNEYCGNYPLLSLILKMDSVARVSMLKKRISSFCGMNTLLKIDCMWLFALCAVVDTPIDADTSASLRSLLRKCADLLAGKVETDDEVATLNILATISGRYFGQLES